MLAALPAGEGPRSVKDSFADVGLSPAGFHVLFESSWLVHRHDAAAPGEDWSRADDAGTLRAWQHAWGDPSGDGPVRAGLTTRPLPVRRRASCIAAGAAAS